MVAKFYLNEPGREAVRALAREMGRAVTSGVAVAEVSAAVVLPSRATAPKSAPRHPLCRLRPALARQPTPRRRDASATPRSMFLGSRYFIEEHPQYLHVVEPLLGRGQGGGTRSVLGKSFPLQSRGLPANFAVA